ncbi:MAG TPA: galactokinase [Steroidobacteraceae bacterium]|nr:galactokinase [Steroidobacteraceae bacterium]
MTDLNALRSDFIDLFCSSPEFVRAPGRVNLIGEHTDYNAGFVMPAAIGFYTTVGIASRSDRQLQVRSSNFAETLTLSLPEPGTVPRSRGGRSHWTDYVLGVAWALQEHGVGLRGADLLIHGEVPLGAGLSSSASLEVAVALALSRLAGVALGRLALATLCQQAENEYVGMRCGIMDQFTAVSARAGHALMIDCRSLEHQHLPLNPRLPAAGQPVRLVICNTLVRHQLAGSEYSRRREQCEQGVRTFARIAPGIQALRDVSPALLQAHESQLDPVIYRRCRHVVSENERVREAAKALVEHDLARFGQLMRDSHRSLRDDYEVSCDELDLMVRLAESIDGVYGARMTGGGFGGCTVNLVRADAVTRFRSLITARYAGATGRSPEIYVCEAVDGAGPLERAT